MLCLCVIRYPRYNVLLIVNECFMQLVNVRKCNFAEYTLHKGFIVVASKINADMK